MKRVLISLVALWVLCLSLATAQNSGTGLASSDAADGDHFGWIDLFDEVENRPGMRIIGASHTTTQDGEIQVDEFPYSRARCTVQTPLGDQTLDLVGPTTVNVYIQPIGEARDGDNNGLDEVDTEMGLLELEGMSVLGPVTVGLRDPNKPPFQRSMGKIEETINTKPGRLDLPPFAPSGSAESYFDVYFEVHIAGMTLHNREPKRMRTRITKIPPAQQETYSNLDVIELFDENGDPTGLKMAASFHTPNPILKPAGTDEFDSVALIDLQLHSDESMTVRLDGPTVVRRDDPVDDTFETEIVGMNLFGLDPSGMAILCRESPELSSPGKTTLAQLPEGDFIVESFFDLWAEIFPESVRQKSGLQSQRLRTTGPIRLEARINAFPPLGSAYSTSPSFPPVPLVDDEGTEVGRITRFVLFVGQPAMFSVAAGGSSGLDPADILAPGTPPVVVMSRESLGLQEGDDIDALSNGRDFLLERFLNFPRFSVDRESMGVTGSAVRAEATSALAEAHGDEFGLKPFGPDDSPCIGSGPNYLCYDENGVPGSLLAPKIGLLISDDLDALTEALPERTSKLFFSLAPGSPTLAALGAGPADILVSQPGSAPSIFATAGQLRLRPDDDIDAFCLMEAGDREFDPDQDEVRFSLNRDSPSLRRNSPADILRPGRSGPTVATEESDLGLRGGRSPDNLNALKCRALP